MELRLRCRDAGGRRKGGVSGEESGVGGSPPSTDSGFSPTECPMEYGVWYGTLRNTDMSYISEPSTGQLHPVPRMPSPQGPTLYGRFAQRSVIGLRGGSTPGTS